MRNYLMILGLVAASVTMSSCIEEMRAGDNNPRSGPTRLVEIRGEEEAVLTAAPNVPPPITREHATKVIVKLEMTRSDEAARRRRGLHVLDVRRRRAGAIHPRARGRLRRVHLKQQPDSKMPHNIDLHAVTGPGRRRGRVAHCAGAHFEVLVYAL